ncbi:Type cbb3 cytochrome oxidase biogenesis protein CcoI [Minicystis rosea]|nr:Type cbb3 cytochrome oxidase biogenesis protein CcoI [Minicystis rosea]
MFGAPSTPGEVAATCAHCNAELGAGAVSRFCCTGCREVHALLGAENLERYYALRGDRGRPVADTRPELRDRKWIDLIEARLATSTALHRIDLDIQGLHCAGCVYLIEELFRREAGGARVIVNPSLGTLELLIRPEFPLRRYVEHIERFGYVLGPALKQRSERGNDLLLRLGICAALAMNSMLFSISIYAGLDDPALLKLFHGITFALSLASVFVGGTVFFRSAWQGIRRGIFHLDLPIALGIVLAFAGSAHSVLTRAGRASYFDTVDVFITLMLLGRFLQERVIDKNRAELLDAAGVDTLLTRRLDGARVDIVPVRAVAGDDVLLVSPGDVVPVAAAVMDEEAEFSLDWINGESAPVRAARGEIVPAGACVAGARAVRLRAAEDFASSSLVRLLRSPTPRAADAARTTPWWSRVTRRYVLLVLTASAFGFAFTMARTGDAGRAIDVVTAILTVTCPCAFGIAVPLAYEIVQARLRRVGLLVRSPGFLDRAIAVRRVVFDKTGTLTTGVLRVEGAEAIAALTGEERSVLYNLAARSTHPKSIAVKRAMGNEPFDASLTIEEQAGRGLLLRTATHEYRLGDPAWAAPGCTTTGDVVFAEDGVVRAAFTTVEDERPDAREEIAELTRAGFEVWILSGDREARVKAIASRVGVPEARALAGCTPEDKAAWLHAHDRGDTLMLGDGINDSLAVAAAHCSGTPAVDRPFLAARSDFYLVTAGLRPVRLALAASRRLETVVRRDLTGALLYNGLAITLACAGWMSPLVCAVFMPLSSLSILLATTRALSEGSTWKSSAFKSS